jgi:hypothetical protein
LLKRAGARVKIAGIVCASFVGLGLASAPSALAFNCGHRLDGFNRPDSTSLGAAWNERAPSIGVEANAATNPNATTALATYNGVHANQACADVFDNGVNVEYVAIVLGYKNLQNSIFVKVQNNADLNAFSHVFFYRGNNGNNGQLAGSRVVKPFVGARIHVAWRGSKVELDIDTNFNNKPDQRIVIRHVSTAGLGRKIGLGIYGHAFADNFSVPK